MTDLEAEATNLEQIANAGERVFSETVKATLRDTSLRMREFCAARDAAPGEPGFTYPFLMTTCEELNDLSPIEVLHGLAIKNSTVEPCQARLLDLPQNERNAKVMAVWRLRELEAADVAVQAPIALKVWYGSMPETNGKTNWTAILHRGDVTEGITIERSEYPDRVRYEADRMRWMIGEIDKEPWILDYDADKRSDYVAPAAPAKVEAWMHRTTGALLHEQSKDLCDARRNSGVWMPLGEVKR